VGSYLRIYLTLVVTTCSGERSCSKLKMVERTKERIRQNMLNSLILKGTEHKFLCEIHINLPVS